MIFFPANGNKPIAEPDRLCPKHRLALLMGFLTYELNWAARVKVAVGVMLSGVSLPEGVGIVGHVGEVIECLSSSVETFTSVALFDTIGF